MYDYVSCTEEHFLLFLVLHDNIATLFLFSPHCHLQGKLLRLYDRGKCLNLFIEILRIDCCVLMISSFIAARHANFRVFRRIALQI